MAELNSTDKSIIEKFLQMDGGYVLQFSNRTFEEFVMDSVKVSAYDIKYDIPDVSGSKANRLRGILRYEQNHKVGTLIEDLARHRYHSDENLTDADKRRFELVLKIASRLKSQKIVENIEAIKETVENMDFSILAKSIKDSIEKNEPETALDRLHTYSVHFFGQLSKKHGIEYSFEETLNALSGKYIKRLKEKGLVESGMTERILKSSLSILESYNDVRNNKSLAHPNKVLNYDESLLIVNNISNNIRFVQSIESKHDAFLRAAEQKRKPATKTEWTADDLPF